MEDVNPVEFFTASFCYLFYTFEDVCFYHFTGPDLTVAPDQGQQVEEIVETRRKLGVEATLQKEIKDLMKWFYRSNIWTKKCAPSVLCLVFLEIKETSNLKKKLGSSFQDAEERIHVDRCYI